MLSAMLACALVGLPAAAQDCEVKIGDVGPMTGGGAGWGLAEKAGTEFEAAWTNANGGLQVGNRKCKVTVVVVDGQSTAAGGAAASNYLASQNVHIVIGPIPSPETAGYKPVAKRNNQVNFASSFSVDAIGPEFPLAFQKALTPAAWGVAAVKSARERFNFKDVIIVGPNDQGGTDTGKALAKSYGDAGVKPSTEWYQRGTTNFSPLATRLMNMNPGTIELGPMPPGEATLLVKQLNDAGYTGAYGRLGSGAADVIKNSGGVEKYKAFYWTSLVPTEDAGIQRMNADYQRVMKVPVPDNALFYSAQIAAEQLLRAVSKAGTDQDAEKIAAELRKSTPESRYLGKGGWRGKTQYGSNQQLAFPIGLDIVADGKHQQHRVDIASE